VAELVNLNFFVLNRFHSAVNQNSLTHMQLISVEKVQYHFFELC